MSFVHSEPDPPVRTLPDRLFKEFLQRFLPDFLLIFFPAEAERLNFTTLKFLDKELVINLPDQQLRITDIAAEVETWQGEPELLIIHVEVEGRNRQTLPQRMSEYYSIMRVLRQKPVLPIALVLLPNVGGLLWQTYTEQLFGHELLRFQYGQVGIRDLLSHVYLAENNPVAAALATLMNPDGQSQATIKLTALQKIVASDLSEGDKLFLVKLVATYLPTIELVDVREEIMRDLAEIEMSWFDKLHEQGREQGLEQGLEQGRLQGELQGKRDSLLLLLSHRFGDLPEALVAHIHTVDDSQQLSRLIQLALTIQSLDELALSPNAAEHTDAADQAQAGGVGEA